ncbi:MAG: glucose-6-phosphate dehydrogenase assembly protein OpcA [Opitutales bacterium]
MSDDAASETLLIDALPGLRMPVTQVTRELSSMWMAPEPRRGRPPEDFRASQLNLILHFGLHTSAEEAQDRFQTAVAFAKVYPCRIIVLCPMGRERSDRLLDAKLYAECFLGEGLREMCCCEALILGYPTREAGFLTNQVSTWLEGDLPVYLWTHRVPADRLRENHWDFLQMCRRIVYDGAIEAGALGKQHFPEPERVVDLAAARLLPVRQALGQFLSGFAPATLIEGMERVEVAGSSSCHAEAIALAEWTSSRLRACAEAVRSPFTAPVECNTEARDACLAINWHFTGGRKFLTWELRDASEGRIRARFGEAETAVPLPTRFLNPVRALSEALFFS